MGCVRSERPRGRGQWTAGTVRVFGTGAVCMVMLAGLAFVSCQTRKATPEPAVQIVQRAFRPAKAVSPLSFEKGGYGNLFAPSSYGVWVDDTVTALRRAAAVAAGETITPEMEAAAGITTDHIVIECHMDSVFADMSIAYDVVGCRGISIYLQMPDGRRIKPARTVIDTSAVEEQRGALKLFGRTNIMVFPKGEVWLDAKLVSTRAACVRLVLEGYGSTFYLEWPEASPTQPLPEPTASERMAMLKVGLADFYRRVGALMHRFD